MGQDQKFEVGTKGAGGQGRLEVRITSPSSKAVPCVVEPQPGKAASVVKYIPKEEGVYTVEVCYDGNPVPGSPFPVEAQLPPDPSKVEKKRDLKKIPIRKPYFVRNLNIPQVRF